MDYGYWDKFQSGFIQIKSENVAFSELYSRKDIYTAIYDRYKHMSLDCDNIYPPFIEGSTAAVSISFVTFELFIFQDEFLENIDQGQLKDIFKLSYEKLLSKVARNYNDIEKIVSVAILGKIMYKMKFKLFIDEINNNDYIEFFITNIPNYIPNEINPVEIITRYAAFYYYTI